MQHLCACFAKLLPWGGSIVAGRVDAWPGAGAGLRRGAAPIASAPPPPAPVPFHFAIPTEGLAMAAVLDDFTWIRA
ncbi:hypothetical protein TPA0907_09360 [Micromonospora humidisoli]|nr:hypothetical protein TPA0907_09360 [Micromonospora sp. AKA109]